MFLSSTIIPRWLLSWISVDGAGGISRAIPNCLYSIRPWIMSGEKNFKNWAFEKAYEEAFETDPRRPSDSRLSINCVPTKNWTQFYCALWNYIHMTSLTVNIRTLSDLSTDEIANRLYTSLPEVQASLCCINFLLFLRINAGSLYPKPKPPETCYIHIIY